MGAIGYKTTIIKDRLTVAAAKLAEAGTNTSRLGADAIADFARVLVSKQTGSLESTIRTQAVNQYRTDVLAGGAPLEALADTDYALPVEEGWFQAATFGGHGGPGGHVAAPYMLPAADIVRSELPFIATAQVQEALNEASL